MAIESMLARERADGAAPPPATTPEKYVRDKVAGSGSSFSLAFRFLRPRQRAAITAYYAFCREVDDAVDEAPSPSAAAGALWTWRREVAEAFAGSPGHPALRALMPLAADFGIGREHLDAIIDGCQMDLVHRQFRDFATLERYCALVAGTVGEVAVNVFGRSEPATLHYARKLALAMQLTNIIRDVGEDARRGRIYLPMDDLRRFGVTEAEILATCAPWAYGYRFDALMRFQAQRAHALYDEAMVLLPAADRQRQKPGLMMANVYRALLREIEATGFQVLHRRTRLTSLRKAWIAARTHVQGR